MANVTTNFLPIKGNWKSIRVPMLASTAMQEGAYVAQNGSGVWTLVTGATANLGTSGILEEAITSGDADYAVAGKLKNISVPMDETAEMEGTVGAGTFTAADVGKAVAFNDSVSVAVDTSGTQLQIVAYISSTRGRFKPNTSKLS